MEGVQKTKNVGDILNATDDLHARERSSTAVDCCWSHID